MTHRVDKWDDNQSTSSFWNGGSIASANFSIFTSNGSLRQSALGVLLLGPLPPPAQLPDAELQAKEQAILDCLQGINDEVDLWQLRELALSPGGLVRTELRRRAWPKLVGCHELILRPNDQGALINPKQQDLMTLQHDVQVLHWNVMAHLQQSSRERKSQEQQQAAAIAPTTIKRKVSFQLDDDKENGAPNAIVSPTSSEESGGKDLNVNASEMVTMREPRVVTTVNDDDPSVQSAELGSFSPHTVPTPVIVRTHRDGRLHRASRVEQRVLYNVVLGMLRLAPGTNSATINSRWTVGAAKTYFLDHRYYYCRGLIDLAAVLLINLESPSLSSLLLQQLAPHHLRDHLRKDAGWLELALQQSFATLMFEFCPTLQANLQQAGLTLPTYAKTWVTTWFTQEDLGVHATSRILDVLLVSHPSMVLYVSVALLCEHESVLDEVDTMCLRELFVHVKTLPTRCENWEAVLARAVRMMKKLSPDQLLQQALNRSDGRASSRAKLDAIQIWQAPPAWATNATVPSDWKLLQQARDARDGKTPAMLSSDNKALNIDMDHASLYPLARAAAGRSNAAKSQWQRKWTMVFFAALLIVSSAMLPDMVRRLAPSPPPALSKRLALPAASPRRRIVSAVVEETPKTLPNLAVLDSDTAVTVHVVDDATSWSSTYDFYRGGMRTRLLLMHAPLRQWWHMLSRQMHHIKKTWQGWWKDRMAQHAKA